MKNDMKNWNENKEWLHGSTKIMKKKMKMKMNKKMKINETRSRVVTRNIKKTIQREIFLFQMFN